MGQIRVSKWANPEYRTHVATYDEKAQQIRIDQQGIRSKLVATQHKSPEPKAALDLIDLISKTAELFAAQSAAERRKFLSIVVGEAVWKGGELRMSLRTPFEKMRLSNSARATNNTALGDDPAILDNWRRGGDSNPR